MPGGPLNLISTNLPRPWSPRESSPSGKIPTVEPGIFFLYLHPFLLPYYCYIPFHLFKLPRIRRTGRNLYCLLHSHRFTTLHHYPPSCFVNCHCRFTFWSSYMLLLCNLCSSVNAILLVPLIKMYVSHSLVQVYAFGGGGFPPLLPLIVLPPRSLSRKSIYSSSDIVLRLCTR